MRPIFYNHLDGYKCICTKDGLIKTLQHFYMTNESASRASYSVFDTTPTTYIIDQSKEHNGELNLLSAKFKEISLGALAGERMPAKHCQKNMWLVKPAFLNRGRGIGIFKSMKDIQDYMFNKNIQIKDWVVQKYIERPLLLNGRKFDIRIWVIVTEDLKIYFYRQGYLRTSSGTFDLADKNNFVHLTNHCFQVAGENYAKHEDGNTLSY